ncbi:MAG: type II secretion system F family protein, partial [Verrucomicrobiales bacterium]|nr:type II secretion system F family protein [Verrucomicrobiales bacterium]
MNGVGSSVWAEWLNAAVGVGVALAVYVCVWLPLFCGALYVIYFLLTLPMRRNERARLLLDVVELGLKAGHTPEATIQSAAASRDVSLGLRFHLLNAHLQSGLRLGEALERVPALVPAQVRAIWRAGERIGDVARVLPACRQLLRDGVSQTRSAMNYLVVLLFCITPLAVLVTGAIAINAMPVLHAVFAETTTAGLPPFSRALFEAWRSGPGLGIQC